MRGGGLGALLLPGRRDQHLDVGIPVVGCGVEAGRTRTFHRLCPGTRSRRAGGQGPGDARGNVRSSGLPIAVVALRDGDERHRLGSRCSESGAADRMCGGGARGSRGDRGFGEGVAGDRRHRQEEARGGLGQGCETTPAVEACGALVDRVDDDERRGDLRGLSQGAEECVEEDQIAEVLQCPSTARRPSSVAGIVS